MDQKTKPSTGPFELESAEQTRDHKCLTQPESCVEAVLVQIAAHAVHVALSATARGHLLLVALERLQWRVPESSVCSEHLLPLAVAQTRTRSVSASVRLVESAPHERVLCDVRRALSQKVRLLQRRQSSRLEGVARGIRRTDCIQCENELADEQVELSHRGLRMEEEAHHVQLALN